MNQIYEFYPLAENAVVIQLGMEISGNTFERVQQIAYQLEKQKFDGFIEIVPSFTTVTVYYSPVFFEKKGAKFPYENVCHQLKEILATVESIWIAEERIVEIPVCYGGEFGPDLDAVCEITEMNQENVIELHCGGEYVVYAIGFAPGFPYIGGMNEKLACPRKSSPRRLVPAGSVGIAGKQTGIYSLDTPGGWQIIGRTPVKLFLPHEKNPSLLKAGNRIRFVPISQDEYWAVKGGQS
ncbi:MAG: 5-oxoprolinase subunit PxpB [Bacillota bacterium]|nr:5-oxoprolinase subunit PxpB [Bacillota bacterium]